MRLDQRRQGSDPPGRQCDLGDHQVVFHCIGRYNRGGKHRNQLQQIEDDDDHRQAPQSSWFPGRRRVAGHKAFPPEGQKDEADQGPQGVEAGTDNAEDSGNKGEDSGQAGANHGSDKNTVGW